MLSVEEVQRNRKPRENRTCSGAHNTLSDQINNVDCDPFLFKKLYYCCSEKKKFKTKKKDATRCRSRMQK